MGYYEDINCCKNCEDRFPCCQSAEKCAKWAKRLQLRQKEKDKLQENRLIYGYAAATSDRLRKYYKEKCKIRIN